MSNEVLLKSYEASGAIAANLIVKETGTDGVVSVSTASTDKFAGVNAELDLADGDRGDICKIGIKDVVYGGVVAAGDPLTANATGQAIKAAPAAGVNANIIGFAQLSGVAGDIGSVLLAPGVIQG